MAKLPDKESDNIEEYSNRAEEAMSSNPEIKPITNLLLMEILNGLVAKEFKQGTQLISLGIRFEVISQEPYKFKVAYPSGDKYMCTVPDKNVDTFTERPVQQTGATV